MPYRVAPPREVEPSTERVHVITLRRYGWLWIFGIAAVSIFMSLIGLSSYERVSLSCSRASAGEEARCALVIEGVTSVKRDEVSPSAYHVKVQDVLLGEDGSRPHLGVHPSAGPVRWFQLGPRNTAVATSFDAFVTRQDALRYDEELEVTWTNALWLPLSGAFLIAMVLGLEVRQRLEVLPESGILRVARRYAFGITKKQSFDLDAIEDVDTEQEGDGEIYAVVLEHEKRRDRIVTGSHGRVCDVASELKTILRARRSAREARASAERAKADAEAQERQVADARLAREIEERARAEERADRERRQEQQRALAGEKKRAREERRAAKRRRPG